MQTIYRVEHETSHIGPYHEQDVSGSVMRILRMFDNKNRVIPMPLYDVGIDRSPNKNEFCGFIDEEQLHQWFSVEALQELKKLDFIVIQYVVEVTAIGERQCLFIRDKENE